MLGKLLPHNWNFNKLNTHRGSPLSSYSRNSWASIAALRGKRKWRTQRWSAFAGLCSKVFFTFPALCDNQPLPPSFVELNGIASTWRNPAPHPHPSSVAFVSVPYALFICTNLSHTTLSSLGHCLTFRPDSPDSPTLPGNPSWPCGENKFHIIWDKYTFVLLSL